MSRFIHFLSWLFFLVAFLLAGLAVWEKLANAMGQTLLRGYAPSRLMEFAAVVLLFVVAMQLREVRLLLETKD